MITFATMYPVDSQAISSSVAPRFPIMWGIATFTMLVSRSSSTDASETVIAMMYLYLYRSVSAPRPLSGRAAVATVGLLGRDGDDHAHPGPQRPIGIVLAVEPDAHRDALHDLGIVARRVVRGQERELRPRGRRDALHVSLEVAAGIGVHREVRGVARPYVGGLRLLQVRGHPDVVEGDCGHQRLTGLHELADLDGLLAHDAVRGGDDARVGQVERRLDSGRAGRGHPGIGADEVRLRSGQGRVGGTGRRLGRVELLLRNDLLVRKRLDPLQIGVGLLGVGLRLLHLRLGLTHPGPVAHGRERDAEVGVGLGQTRSEERRVGKECRAWWWTGPEKNEK